MPNERFLTTAEALGDDVMAKLANLEDQILQLDLLVANADLTEKQITTMDSAAFGAFETYAAEHPEERWAKAKVADDRYIALDEVPSLTGRQIAEALAYPVIHVQLLGWWLAHAWRFIDLVDSAIRSLDSWNVTTAALASRALIEEVSCLLYEADDLAGRWSEAKSSSATNRAEAVNSLFADRLLEFRYASRGLGDNVPWPATNVMTYINRLTKRYGHANMGQFYALLSNAAHPALGARMAYGTFLPRHETGAFSRRRLSRRPTAAGKATDTAFVFAATAANATDIFGGEGGRLLYQALFMVDDFGLTTRSGLLTRTRYWRKLLPGTRSSDTCPCKCGKWPAAKHHWGLEAPKIRVPRDWL